MYWSGNDLRIFVLLLDWLSVKPFEGDFGTQSADGSIGEDNIGEFVMVVVNDWEALVIIDEDWVVVVVVDEAPNSLEPTSVRNSFSLSSKKSNWCLNLGIMTDILSTVFIRWSVAPSTSYSKR